MMVRYLTIGDYERVLTSPNCLGNHPPNIICTWNILGNSNSRIQLKFVDFQLQGFGCNYDFLEVYTDKNHVEKLCDREGVDKTAEQLTLSSNQRYDHQYHGFKAIYQNGKDVLYKYNKIVHINERLEILQHH